MDDGSALRAEAGPQVDAITGSDEPGPGGAGSAILIEVGAGELIDKITILRIKAARMSDPGKRANVLRELATLEKARQLHVDSAAVSHALVADLSAVNLDLWTIEDEIRACEARGDFGPRFIELARAVYRTNDRRAALKKNINILTRAAIVEEKSYGEAG